MRRDVWNSYENRREFKAKRGALPKTMWKLLDTFEVRSDDESLMLLRSSLQCPTDSEALRNGSRRARCCWGAYFWGKTKTKTKKSNRLILRIPLCA